MKPRVFISSTYYDLKYVRESLEKLLLNLNFDPVLFEANKVTFEHGKPLDISCFNEVKTCHIMILIIGGRYGSIISDQDSEHEKDIYDKEYTSITKKEYETALRENIPTFIFIDKNVYGEYNTYKINRDFYNDPIKSKGFKFVNIDSLNVFKFIDLVATKAIKAFERIEEIESYLKEQISGMFYLYLESLKSRDKQNEIFDTVLELKSLTTNMNAMINEVGKNVINPEKYQEVIDEQFVILLNFFFEKFSNMLTSTYIETITESTIENLSNFFLDKFFTIELHDRTSYSYFYKTRNTKTVNYSDYIDDIILDLNNEMKKINDEFYIANFDRSVITDYINTIQPLISSQKQKDIFKEMLHGSILSAGLPI